MKILQICNKVPFPPKDGGSIATWALATGLVNEDAIIHILALNTSKHAAASVELPEDIKENIQLEMIDHDTGIHIPSLVFNLFFSRQPYNLIRFYSARFQSKLKDLLTREHFDIVLIEGIAMCQYISTIRKVSRAKIIYRAHNSEFQIWQRLSMNTSSVLKKHYYKILAKRVDRFESKQFQLIDALVSISKNDEKEFREQGYEGPVHHTPYGINFSEQNASLEIKNKDLIFLGALDWEPNIIGLEWFIYKVWTRLKHSNPDLSFHVAGRNPSEKIINLCKQQGICFYGEIEDPVDFLKKGSVLVVPLFSGSGMRVKIVEGMALGKCIVSTSQGLEGIPAEAGKHLLIADTDELFLKSIKALTSNPNYCEQISIDAKEFIKENFNNFTLTRKLADFFNTLSL